MPKTIKGICDSMTVHSALPAHNLESGYWVGVEPGFTNLKQDAYATPSINAKIQPTEHLGQYHTRPHESRTLWIYLNGIRAGIPDAKILCAAHFQLTHMQDDSGVFQAGFHVKSALWIWTRSACNRWSCTPYLSQPWISGRWDELQPKWP
jgi:hypothetical protein